MIAVANSFAWRTSLAGTPRYLFFFLNLPGHGFIESRRRRLRSAHIKSGKFEKLVAGTAEVPVAIGFFFALDELGRLKKPMATGTFCGSCHQFLKVTRFDIELSGAAAVEIQ